MATKSLPAGRTGRRAFFGAMDADGWSWAFVKAFAWFIVIIMVLGYIPDRAYYFTVNRTIDVGIMFWSPINLCPAENGHLPCPAPVGAVVPWQPSPNELALPSARTGGSAAQLGSHLLYIGGSDGNAATSTTYAATASNGNFSAWSEGPALPEARSDAGLTTLSGAAYLVGGDGPDGKPTNTVWALPTTGDKGDLGTWAPVPNLTLPEARAGAVVVAVTDGILVAGGRGPDGAPSATVWKSTLDSKGALGPFQEQGALVDGVADAVGVFAGQYVWIYGGTDSHGASGAVERGLLGSSASANPSAAASVAPAASIAPQPQGVQQWAVNNAANLPAARTGAAGFTANGTIYLVGGSDGQVAKSELYWAVPDVNGDISDGWHHLDVTDLPAGGRSGASAIVTNNAVVVIGGTTQGGIATSSVRASLAPQEPFFQLGPVGVVVPALQIPGEIGQQLGYLSAAGVATLDFALLVLVGWAYAHKPQVRAWWERRRARR
jgi:hypothetical protein